MANGLPDFMTEPGTYARVVSLNDDLMSVTIWSDQHPPREVAEFLKNAVPSLVELCYTIGTSTGVNFRMLREDVDKLQHAMDFFQGALI